MFSRISAIVEYFEKARLIIFVSRPLTVEMTEGLLTRLPMISNVEFQFQIEIDVKMDNRTCIWNSWQTWNREVAIYQKKVRESHEKYRW